MNWSSREVSISVQGKSKGGCLPESLYNKQLPSSAISGAFYLLASEGQHGLSAMVARNDQVMKTRVTLGPAALRKR